MSINTGRAAFIAAAYLLMVCMGVCLTACGAGGFSREEVEEIDTAFRAGTSSIDETTAFVRALEKFNFENAAFFEDTMSAVDASRAAALKLLASVEEMESFSYDGALSTLGRYVEDYEPFVVEAVEELDGVIDGLSGMLQAIEPVLREEAVISQMEEPGDDSELLGRLQKLDAALATSLAELPGLEVPVQLAEYRSLLVGIFTSLHKVVRDLKAVASGQTTNVTIENNPDFLRMQELMADYPGVVGEIEDNLEISRIDPRVEKVELEINRLFLEEGQ
jgi:hypothetical protein